MLPNSLQLLPSEHLIDCLRTAVGMGLEPEFIRQLQDEIKRRNIQELLSMFTLDSSLQEQEA